MKWPLVLLNLAAACAVAGAGHLLRAVHRTHSFSTYVELEKRGALAKPPAAATAGDPVTPEGAYDVAKRLEGIGALDTHLPGVTYGAAAVFLLNAVAFLGRPKKSAA